MSRQRLRKIIAIILSVSMLFSISDEYTWTQAASANEDLETVQEDVDTTEEDTSQLVSETEQSEGVTTEEVNAEEHTATSEKSEEHEMDTEAPTVDEPATEETISEEDSFGAEKGSASRILQKMKSLALLSSSESDTSISLESYVTKDAEGKLTLTGINSGTIYLISSYEQWIALANYSQNKEHNLEGFIFCFHLRDGNETLYDFTKQTDFVGLGSNENPFAGKLYSSYLRGTITLKLNRPLFNCLSSKAEIQNINIEVVSSVAGLAENLVVDSEKATFNNISISGTIGKDTTTGCVGGLFSCVNNNSEYTFTITGSNNKVGATVKGQTAGGLIGKLTGKTTVLELKGFNNITSLNNPEAESEINQIRVNVYGEQAGGLIGELTGKTTTLKLDGLCYEQIFVDGAANGTAGGLIGFVNGKTEQNTLTLTSTDSTEIVYTRRALSCTGNNMYCGGFFGRLLNTNVEIKCPITFNGNRSNDRSDVKGYAAGGFAGGIENSNITLYNPMVFYNVKMNVPNQTAISDNWKNYGVGIFVGKLIKSTIKVADSFTTSGEAITIKNSSETNTYNYSKPNQNIDKYNSAGFIGYASNSDLLFTENHPCLIKSFYASTSRGNVAGVIGYYEVSEPQHKIQYVNVKTESGEKLRLIGWEGNTGGLVGHVKLSDAGVVEFSNCSFNGYIGYAIQEADALFSTGIANVTSDSNATGKIVIQNVSCKSSFKAEANSGPIKAYGGLIGSVDADFEIKNTSIIHDESQNLSNSYYGGLIGIVGSNRKGTITGTTKLGKCAFKGTEKAYGGLIGKVGKNTAISLGGEILALDSSDTATKQTMYLGAKYVGSIVGEIDNSLIYMEKGTNFAKSDSYKCDEIGNYGGVIRNDDWDKDGSNLIVNFAVTGTLSNTIDSVEDLLRFAIAMNTEGAFLPEGNCTSDDSGLNTIDTIRKATYQLTQSSYNLIKSDQSDTWTGLMCLARNDEEGITNCPFQGSFIGITGKSEIIYSVTSYGQPNIGLFPIVVANDDSGSTFENLSLNYQLIYQPMTSSDNSTKNPDKQCAGGIAAQAKGNITVTNVSYIGKVMDTLGSNWPYDDYLGGYFGTYIAVAGSTLSMSQLQTNMTFSYNDRNHIMGGVIGYVNLDAVENKKTCNINIGSTSGPVILSGNIYSNLIYNGSVIRESSFIAQIGSKTENYRPNSVPKCELVISNLSVKDVSQIDNPKTWNWGTEVYYYDGIGGFLGYRWVDVDVTLTDVKVGVDGDATIQAGASFGGLVHTVVGKMLVDGVTIGEKTTFDTKSGGKTGGNTGNSALLVSNGQYMYMDVKDYTVADNIQVTNYTGTNFDELVGITKGGDGTTHGGIVSIRASACSKDVTDCLGRGSNSYKSFYTGHVNVNGKILQNPNTRYYYDLHQLNWNDTDYGTLDSADDVLRWHLLHYANESIRIYLDSNYEAETYLPGSYTIKGDIDMSGYSIYPTSVSDESYSGGGTIKFNAQGIIDGESTGSYISKYPDDSNSQHYQMHAGLFENVSDLTVKNLTLTGTYSKGTSSAGALVTGSINGRTKWENGSNVYDTTVKNTFKNITLNNLWCVSHSTISSYDAPIGLMIADISSGAQVSFDGIRMTGYIDSAVTDQKAASALIGNVGGEDATYISISFINMDIADAADGQSSDTLNSSKIDEVMAKASLIYSYEYKDNCSAIYTFTYEDYLYGRCTTSEEKNNVVTLGEELGNNGETPNYALVEYFDLNEPVGKMQGLDHGITFDCKHYIPYVYTGTKKILVNPKVGNLVEGCGTYEDPYIINSDRQIITLYRYLYDEDSFKDVLAGAEWKVNPTGDDSRLCDKTDKVDTGHGTAITYNSDEENNFPTKAKLSQAYYQITKDIDLSTYPEFTGFGRTDQPFVGVFVGKETDSKYPTITMSNVEDASKVTDYGWIQYAKGCVVKDLVIEFSQPVLICDNGNEGGTAGGVIATVLGGENIIDNVTVQGQTLEDNSTVKCFDPNSTKARIGGYVGAVNEGGVILRNMKTENLSKFSVTGDNTTTFEAQYYYICGIIGRVFDGYVVYDGASESEPPLFKNLTTKLYDDTNNLPDSRSYDIINGKYLESDESIDKITWSSDAGYGIQDNKQLLVISMALNSGLLNYNTNSGNLYVGYDNSSRQRSGNYNYVGNVNSDDNSATARSLVIQFDNDNGASEVTYHSYLSRYFKNWTEMANDKGKLNPDQATFKLTGSSYDMSKYDSAFRGLGARYFKTENIFHGNLEGLADSSTEIKLNMIVDGVQNATDAALLNNVTFSSNDKKVSISNITLTGFVCNKSDVGENFSIKPFSNTNSSKNASALISTLERGKITVKNVNLNQMEVYSQNYAGGIIAYANNQNSELTFTNCGISGNTASKTHVQGCSDTGGIIGYAKAKVTIDTLSKLEYLEVESNAQTSGGDAAGKNAGGLIGTIEKNLTASKINANHLTVESSGNKSSDVHIGGLVGYANGGTDSYTDITLKNLTVQNRSDSYADNNNNKYGIAGVVGTTQGNVTMTNVIVGSDIENESDVSIGKPITTVSSNNSFGAGGLVGRYMTSGKLTLTNCQVLGILSSDKNSSTTKIYGCGSNVGGILGNSQGVDGEHIKVSGVYIETGRYSGGMISWLENGSTNTLKDAEVSNVTISLIDSNTSSSDRGDIGGLIGHGGYQENATTINLSGVKAENIILKSNICKNAGGIFGRLDNATLNISKYTDSENHVIANTVSNCFLTGKYVGGVVGSISEEKHTNNWDCGSIDISGNKLISSWESSNSLGQNAAAGGFAGDLVTQKTNSQFRIQDIKIRDNLISAYDSNSSCLAQLGGVCGKIGTEVYFNDVTLSNNYIGIMNPDELGNKVEQRKEKLYNTLIDGSDGLRASLCYLKKDTDNNLQIGEKIGTTTVDPDNYYQYSYLQGAVFGDVTSDASSDSNTIGIPKLINVHISYTDPKYRPVSDVGTTSGISLKSNSDMYDNVRKRCVIVYDGRMTDTETKTIGDLFSSSLTDNSDLDTTIPYVFGNLESIMDTYTSANSGDEKRMAYRLDDNYQGSRAINQDNLVTNYEKLTPTAVYENTYKNEDKYLSPYELDSITLPMVMYSSAENGTLDQVIQTYINILTNNSGALNSYANYTKKKITNILSVDTYAAKIENGSITISSSGDESVSVKSENGKYYFYSETGDEFTSSTEGTFTLIQVTYGWKLNDTWGDTWTLLIPIYVEKRLNVYSNMKMLEGIQYNTASIKTNGKNVVTEDPDKPLMTVAKGSSYSIYAEFIYRDYDKFSNVYIPKSLCMSSKTAANPYFLKGTNVTLIALDEGSKPYYYTVTESKVQKLDFTKFADANGNLYQLKNIADKTSTTTNTKIQDYTDICNATYSGESVLERYVLLIDTSKVSETIDKARTFELHVSMEDLKDNESLYMRTDMIEHCYEYVNEVAGISYKINTATENTHLVDGSQISQDGRVKVNLQYDISADAAYWISERVVDNSYLDVGFYLTARVGENDLKVPLPSGTTIVLKNPDSGEEVSTPAMNGQTIAYYYQSLRQAQESNKDKAICMADVKANISNKLEIAFDFSNADMSELDGYSDSQSFSVVAELVLTPDKDMPAAGDVKDTYQLEVGSQMKTDFGFALNVDDMTTLGMNQYSPEDSDKGVVSYTASIAFPTSGMTNLEAKDYRIVYQIEEKVKTPDNKTAYQAYTGYAVSIYLGKFDQKQSAIDAATGVNSVCSGKGITEVTYHFSTDNITNGADLLDGKNASTGDGVTITKGIVRTHCTLVANCSKLNMTNYRVKAYLIVSDPAAISDNTEGCMKSFVLREGNWAVSSEVTSMTDLKNDFFVFTVAKIKTSM